jgi:putative DNA primase/helicase
LILASETQEGGRLDERLVKDITGGEELRAEAKFMPGFRFRPQAKVWMTGNHKPRISGTDEGIWRRVRLTPFEACFKGAAANPRLSAELREELPGILRWAVEGCRQWNAEGLGLPERVRLAVDDYRNAEDDLGDFIADRIEDAPEAASCLKREVFAAYESWASAEGIRHPMTAKQLSRKLRARGWKQLHEKYWRGVRVAEDKPEGEE